MKKDNGTNMVLPYDEQGVLFVHKNIQLKTCLKNIIISFTSNQSDKDIFFRAKAFSNLFSRIIILNIAVNGYDERKLQVRLGKN